MKDIKNDVSKKGIELNGPKAPYEGDHNVMETISNGIQIHLKQLIELSMTTARRRNDFSTYVVFDQLKRILKDNGDHPSSALKDGFTLAWDEDYNTDLQYQEEIAKQKLEKKFLEDENTMKREMLNYDIERSKLSIYKRKQGEETPWWLREKSCEDNGLLKWEELAIVHAHDRVANKYKLGLYKRGKVTDNPDNYFAPSESTYSLNDNDIVKPIQSNTRCPLHGVKNLTCPLIITVNDLLKNIQQFKKERKIVNSYKMEVEAMLKFGLIPRPR